MTADGPTSGIRGHGSRGHGSRGDGSGGDGSRATGPQVMGVLNVTPDSFSDGGDHLDHDDAIGRGLEMIAEGASVLLV